jgi:hypothetical protein
VIQTMSTHGTVTNGSWINSSSSVTVCGCGVQFYDMIVELWSHCQHLFNEPIRLSRCIKLWSPLSEMSYIARMPIYSFTLFLYIVLQVPTALATNFGILLASVLLQVSLDHQSLQRVVLPSRTYMLPRSKRTVLPSGVLSPYAPLRWAIRPYSDSFFIPVCLFLVRLDLST